MPLCGDTPPTSPTNLIWMQYINIHSLTGYRRCFMSGLLHLGSGRLSLAVEAWLLGVPASCGGSFNTLPHCAWTVMSVHAWRTTPALWESQYRKQSHQNVLVHLIIPLAPLNFPIRLTFTMVSIAAFSGLPFGPPSNGVKSKNNLRATNAQLSTRTVAVFMFWI